eukprot:TRINITY_DN6375_c0_g1_i8.p1 TRINITY_DN6375_c0_g1~~TRINITY_DN6375_c0_g1_i8.p1  ORF type:complete len:254 (+),score=44.68 TRINITY_DN6375_c0_g1_i8:424-1185(+)
MDLFKRTLVPVENVLKEAKLQKDDIHEVLLVGGSTRIPKIQQLLKDYFRGKEPRRGIQPDEAVAYGMAVQGRMEPEEGCTYIIMDIAPLSLGLETAGGAMTVMIPRNTLLPTKKVRTFSTYQDDQDLVTIKVYEGERARVKDNHLLGTFELSGLPPAPQGTMEIEVTFEVDENGILTVTAEDKRNNNKRAVSFTEEKLLNLRDPSGPSHQQDLMDIIFLQLGLLKNILHWNQSPLEQIHIQLSRASQTSLPLR